MASKKSGSRHLKSSGTITSASEILHRRYIKGRPEREASLRSAVVALSLGEYIRELREREEITQQQLADAIGTKRTAISRLENADYQGHSVDLLCRIAKALHGELTVCISTGQNKAGQGVVLAGR